MYILNQTDTGKPCSQHVAHLHSELPEDSLMCWVRVHALDLAYVLDRLTALEDFQAKVTEGAGKMLSHKSVRL